MNSVPCADDIGTVERTDPTRQFPVPGAQDRRQRELMPFSAPGSLSDDEVYAIVAYILSEAKIIKPADTMDAKTLPRVIMPNKNGFIADSRPELELYR